MPAHFQYSLTAEPCRDVFQATRRLQHGFRRGEIAEALAADPELFDLFLQAIREALYGISVDMSTAMSIRKSLANPAEPTGYIETGAHRLAAILNGINVKPIGLEREMESDL